MIAARHRPGTLSTRARHVVESFSPIVVSEMTVAQVRAVLMTHAAERTRYDIHQLLRSARNCGPVTALEILLWLDIHAIDDGHVCVCRHCGKKIP